MRPRGITFIAIALVIAALLFLPVSLLTAIGISHTFGLSGTLGSVIDLILAITASWCRRALETGALGVLGSSHASGCICPFCIVHTVCTARFSRGVL